MRQQHSILDSGVHKPHGFCILYNNNKRIKNTRVVYYNFKRNLNFTQTRTSLSLSIAAYIVAANTLVLVSRRPISRI